MMSNLALNLPRQLFLLALLFAGSCARTSRRATTRACFYFRFGVSISPDGRYAYVVSSNFDLRLQCRLDLGRGSRPSDSPRHDRSGGIVETRILSLAGGLSQSPSGSMAAAAHRGARSSRSLR